MQSYAEEKSLDELQSEMQAFYNVEGNLHPESPLTSLNHLSKDSYFAGKHSDNLWYRVKVNSMLDEGTAAVKMVDFGDFAMIPLDKLQPLWPRYRNLPMQAINASLTGTSLISPTNYLHLLVLFWDTSEIYIMPRSS